MVNRAVDTVIVFRILKILTTPWNKMKAWEFGLIDDNGKRIKSKKPQTKEEKNAFTLLHRLVFNLKRLIELLPFGKTRLVLNCWFAYFGSIFNEICASTDSTNFAVPNCFKRLTASVTA